MYQDAGCAIIGMKDQDPREAATSSYSMLPSSLERRDSIRDSEYLLAARIRRSSLLWYVTLVLYYTPR
jgi:hypothetical protein